MKVLNIKVLVLLLKLKNNIKILNKDIKMQIGTTYNSYQTINSQVSANQSESNAKVEETQTFSSLMDSEKVEEKSEILEYLDKYKAFDSLNEEDAKLFRELLSDGSLDDEDMKKLSFEQTKTMHGGCLKRLVR